MRAVIQRVINARVIIDEKEYSRIGPGLLVLVGVEKEDADDDAATLARRIVELRTFEDDAGKMNRSISEVGGQIHAVTKFTLLGDSRRVRWPSYVPVSPPDWERTLYQRFVNEIEMLGVPVATGVFQAMMNVELMYHGPVTFILD